MSESELLIQRSHALSPRCKWFCHFPVELGCDNAADRPKQLTSAAIRSMCLSQIYFNTKRPTGWFYYSLPVLFAHIISYIIIYQDPLRDHQKAPLLESTPGVPQTNGPWFCKVAIVQWIYDQHVLEWRYWRLSILDISEDDRHLAWCRGLPASCGDIADHCLRQGSQAKGGVDVQFWRYDGLQKLKSQPTNWSKCVITWRYKIGNC